jgi:hypothetical protein
MMESSMALDNKKDFNFFIALAFLFGCMASEFTAFSFRQKGGYFIWP